MSVPTSMPSATVSVSSTVKASSMAASRITATPKAVPIEMVPAVVPAVTNAANDDFPAIIGAVASIVGPRVWGVAAISDEADAIHGAAAQEQPSRRAHAQEDHSLARHASQQIAHSARELAIEDRCEL